MGQYVVYLSASSKDPDQASQEIEAQEGDIDLFLEHAAPRPWQVISILTETSGGRDKDRPQLKTAWELVRQTSGAKLLVASCDRLFGKGRSVPGSDVVYAFQEVQRRAETFGDPSAHVLPLVRHLSNFPTKARY